MSVGIACNHGHGVGVVRGPSRRQRRRGWYGVCNIPNRRWSSSTAVPLEFEAAGAGGKMVVELVGAFNQLAQRMSEADDNATAATSIATTSEAVVFEALKLSIPLLRALPLLPGGRPALSRALSVALLLADLRMDAEVISSALLRHPLSAAALSLPQVRSRLGPGTAHLLHDSLRLSQGLSSRLDLLDLDDDRATAALRRFCLTFYDARAVALELALALDAMTHDLRHLPRFHRQLLSLRVLRIHAPLAHALGLSVSLQLEDLSFRCLFPYSYLYLDTWLTSHNAGAMDDGSTSLVDAYKDRLLRALKADPELSALVSDVSVAGRYKSRYSTMKKLLKDGRRPEEVNDVLGLRVVLQTHSSTRGETACYRTRDIVRSLWKEVPRRTKDYIAHPKPNGYRSLHMAVDISDPGRTRPLMEIQIRTSDMDSFAAGGAASHSLYKAGLTDPQQAMRLKAIMVAAAELATLRLQDLPSPATHRQGVDRIVDHRGRVFRLLDKNGDGRISIDELMEVMEELGAPGEDARHMMHLLDSNSDGSLSSEEFDLFQKQVDFMRSLENRDDHYKSMLNEKLHFAQEAVRKCDETSSITLG